MKKYLDLKVYENKRNGQRIVILPRKKIKSNDGEKLKKVRVVWQ